jgi:hypothetical protein
VKRENHSSTVDCWRNSYGQSKVIAHKASDDREGALDSCRVFSKIGSRDINALSDDATSKQIPAGF